MIKFIVTRYIETVVRRGCNVAENVKTDTMTCARWRFIVSSDSVIIEITLMNYFNFSEGPSCVLVRVVTEILSNKNGGELLSPFFNFAPRARGKVFCLHSGSGRQDQFSDFFPPGYNRLMHSTSKVAAPTFLISPKFNYSDWKRSESLFSLQLYTPMTSLKQTCPPANKLESNSLLAIGI